MKVQLKLPEAFDINSQTTNAALFLVSLGFKRQCFGLKHLKKSRVKNCHESLNIRLKWKLSVPVAKPEFNLHTSSHGAFYLHSITANNVFFVPSTWLKQSGV